MSFLITETVWEREKKKLKFREKRPISFVSLLSVRTKVKILGVMVMAAVRALENSHSLNIRISILQFTEAASLLQSAEPRQTEASALISADRCSHWEPQ